jgi:hypothetical protein
MRLNDAFFFYIIFRFRGYFAENQNVPGDYEYTMAYWHITAAKLAFIVVFEVKNGWFLEPRTSCTSLSNQFTTLGEYTSMRAVRKLLRHFPQLL